MNAIGESPAIKRLLTKLHERHEWEAANAELAATWEEALHEDHDRTLTWERERTKRIARERANDALRALGLPEDAIIALRAPRDEKPVLAAKQFLESGKRFLLLLGQIGVGKTVAAGYVLQEALAARYAESRPSGADTRVNEPALFLEASAFARMGAYGQSDRTEFEKACRADALVIDDLGTERQTETTQQLLGELIGRRHAAKLRTVITSNGDVELLAARVGERAADRIRESSLTSNTKGPSLRTGRSYSGLKAVKP